jgi:hypothetical protein
MAAIDKTYGTKAESEQLWHWLRRRGRKWTRFHYGVESFNHLTDCELRPILNTSVSADKWMARFCPFPFVLERICEVYSPDHVAAKMAARRLAEAFPCAS